MYHLFFWAFILSCFKEGKMFKTGSDNGFPDVITGQPGASQKTLNVNTKLYTHVKKNVAGQVCVV
jgi:hypothetical protein